jgi:hypothetical protein
MAGADVHRCRHAGLQLDAGEFGVRMPLGTLDVDQESSEAEALAMKVQETAILTRPGLANPD